MFWNTQKWNLYKKLNIFHHNTAHYETHIDSYCYRITLHGDTPDLLICAVVPNGVLRITLSTKLVTTNGGKAGLCTQKLTTFIHKSDTIYVRCSKKRAKAKYVFIALWLPGADLTFNYNVLMRRFYSYLYIRHQHSHPTISYINISISIFVQKPQTSGKRNWKRITSVMYNQLHCIQNCIWCSGQ